MEGELRYAKARIEGDGTVPFVDEFEGQTAGEPWLDENCCRDNQAKPTPRRARNDVRPKVSWETDVLEGCGKHEVLGVEPQFVSEGDNHSFLKILDRRLIVLPWIEAWAAGAPQQEKLASKTHIDGGRADLVFRKEGRDNQAVRQRAGHRGP
ncbi:hypothetical protein LRS13_03935 [Svornostia abyssi]|uniref:Uncharacterized protein n=1 Tax=Svornostia abyssi TaxID=2898438 RepID=A0ABY5PJ29_9ACTN|nr:hypothetical protein LRS13_03935 [Parviterribacteraceae bacterium J379]